MNQLVWLPLLLVAPLCSCEDTYAKINGDVTFSPGTITEVNSLLWKFNSNKAAEYDPAFLINEPRYFPPFEGRASVDLKSGSLTITQLTIKDKGEFSVEVNNKQQNDKFLLNVIEEVSSVEITKNSAITDRCVLSCAAEPYSEALKYQWTGNNVRTPNNPTLDVQEADMSSVYTCNASNPVSSKSTKVTARSICEAIHTPPSPGPIIGGSLAVIALIGIAVTAWYLVKNGKNEDSSGADKNKEGESLT